MSEARAFLARAVRHARVVASDRVAMLVAEIASRVEVSSNDDAGSARIRKVRIAGSPLGLCKLGLEVRACAPQRSAIVCHCQLQTVGTPRLAALKLIQSASPFS